MQTWPAFQPNHTAEEMEDRLRYFGRFLRTGIPKSVFSVTHGWSAFGGADHGGRNIGLEGGA
jgi:hypothetical protein